MRVKHLPITRTEYVAMLTSSYEKSGFLPFMSETSIERNVDELLNLAAAFPVDRVIEKRGNKIQTRA